MYDNRLGALVLAAQELLPAEPSDLTGILVAEDQRAALTRLLPDAHSSELTSWLCMMIEPARVQFWAQRLDKLEQEADVHLLLAHDPEYPARLLSCWDRPPLLFIDGRLQTSDSAVAIVGSRAAGEEALRTSFDLGQRVAAAGIDVVSGLAAGVDTAAHEGALSAGGQTVAVMGTGIERVFPEENRKLARRIAREGALVSQFAPDAPRTSTTFLKRNNVIAGLADVSVVIDGQPRSGSRHQSEQAARYERQVLLWAPTLYGQVWAQDAVGRGEAVFVSEFEEVLAAVGAGN